MDKPIGAVQFWEFLRLPYNLVLFVIVVLFWGMDIVTSGFQQWLGAFVVLLLFAGIANILFSLAYLAEFLFVSAAVPVSLIRFRWILFTAGILVAVALELWVILGSGMA